MGTSVCMLVAKHIDHGSHQLNSKRGDYKGHIRDGHGMVLVTPTKVPDYTGSISSSRATADENRFGDYQRALVRGYSRDLEALVTLLFEVL